TTITKIFYFANVPQRLQLQNIYIILKNDYQCSLRRISLLQAVDRIVGHQLTTGDDDHAAAHSLYFLHDMGRKQYCFFCSYANNQIADFDDLIRIKSGSGLVKN